MYPLIICISFKSTSLGSLFIMFNFLYVISMRWCHLITIKSCRYPCSYFQYRITFFLVPSIPRSFLRSLIFIHHSIIIWWNTLTFNIFTLTLIIYFLKTKSILTAISSITHIYLYQTYPHHQSSSHEYFIIFIGSLIPQFV